MSGSQNQSQNEDQNFYVDMLDFELQLIPTMQRYYAPGRVVK